MSQFDPPNEKGRLWPWESLTDKTPMGLMGWHCVDACTTVAAPRSAAGTLWRRRMPKPPTTKPSEPADLFGDLKGRILAALVSVFLVVVGSIWIRMEQRVDKLDERAGRIEVDVQGLRTSTQSLLEMRRSVDEMGRALAELSGLVHGMAQLVPPRRRAELYGLRNATIEQVPLTSGATFHIQRASPGNPIDLTLTVLGVSGDALHYRFEGHVGNAVIRGGEARISINPGRPIPVLVPHLPTPVFYVMVLERTPDSVLLAIGTTKDVGGIKPQARQSLPATRRDPQRQPPSQG